MLARPLWTRSISLLKCSATLILCLLVCFAILQLANPLSLRQISNFSGTYSSAAIPDHDTQSETRHKIRSVWCDEWAKAYIDARSPAGEIELTRNYENVEAPADATSTRQPARELVSSSKAYLEEIKRAHSRFLRSLPVMKRKGKGVFKGRGIVTTGGGEYYGPALIQIQMLRKTGSTLPIEVFLRDRSEYESHMCEVVFPKLGAICLTLSDTLNSTIYKLPRIDHYQVKLLAALFSSFEEILFLDCDNISLLDPSKELFTTEPYLSSGFVSWPDFWAGTESRSFYTVAGLSTFPTNLPARSSESGQILLNKRTHLDLLLLAVYYNIYGPYTYYPLLSQGAIGQGDKETLLAAAIVLGKSYYRVKTPVIKIERDTASGQISGMLQHHPNDDLKNTISPRKVRPAFIHSNTPKVSFSTSGVIENHADCPFYLTADERWSSR